jgi:hypothetical protein
MIEGQTDSECVSYQGDIAQLLAEPTQTVWQLIDRVDNTIDKDLAHLRQLVDTLLDCLNDQWVLLNVLVGSITIQSTLGTGSHFFLVDESLVNLGRTQTYAAWYSDSEQMCRDNAKARRELERERERERDILDED